MTLRTLRARGWLIALCAVWSLAACSTAEPLPFDAATLLAEAKALREPDGPPRPLESLAEALRLAEAHAPDLSEAKLAVRLAEVRAGILTPRRNPRVVLGPEYAFGADQGDGPPLLPFGRFTFDLPLGSVREAQDEAERAALHAVRVTLEAQRRTLALRVRERIVAWTRAEAREQATRAILEAARARVMAAERMIEAGSATVIDRTLFALEASRTEASAREARRDADLAREDLAALIGVSASRWSTLGAGLLPSFTRALPTTAELQALLIDHHPQLGRLRADYAQREAELLLEVQRALPSLSIGPSLGGEAGERRGLIGLELGMTLPIFDRNEEGIAVAAAARAATRERYRAAAARAMGAIDRALTRMQAVQEHWRWLNEEVLPQAAEATTLARRVVDAGVGDALRLLSAERSERALQLERVAAEAGVREAWLELERAVGKPLLIWPGERASGGLSNETLRPRTSAGHPASDTEESAP